MMTTMSPEHSQLYSVDALVRNCWCTICFLHNHVLFNIYIYTTNATSQTFLLFQIQTSTVVHWILETFSTSSWFKAHCTPSYIIYIHIYLCAIMECTYMIAFLEKSWMSFLQYILYNALRRLSHFQLFSFIFKKCNWNYLL